MAFGRLCLDIDWLWGPAVMVMAAQIGIIYSILALGQPHASLSPAGYLPLLVVGVLLLVRLIVFFDVVPPDLEMIPPPPPTALRRLRRADASRPGVPLLDLLPSWLMPTLLGIVLVLGLYSALHQPDHATEGTVPLALQMPDLRLSPSVPAFLLIALGALWITLRRFPISGVPARLSRRRRMVLDAVDLEAVDVAGLPIGVWSSAQAAFMLRSPQNSLWFWLLSLLILPKWPAWLVMPNRGITVLLKMRSYREGALLRIGRDRTHVYLLVPYDGEWHVVASRPLRPQEADAGEEAARALAEIPPLRSPAGGGPFDPDPSPSASSGAKASVEARILGLPASFPVFGVGLFMTAGVMLLLLMAAPLWTIASVPAWLFLGWRSLKGRRRRRLNRALLDMPLPSGDGAWNVFVLLRALPGGAPRLSKTHDLSGVERLERLRASRFEGLSSDVLYDLNRQRSVAEIKKCLPEEAVAMARGGRTVALLGRTDRDRWYRLATRTVEG